MEEKQSLGRRDGLYPLIVEELSRVDRGNTDTEFAVVSLVQEIEISHL